MLALKRVTLAGISQTVIGPYPIRMIKEYFPPIGFLPYIARAWCNFLLDLPLHIAAGGQYPRPDVILAYNRLGSLMEDITCENIKIEKIGQTTATPNGS